MSDLNDLNDLDDLDNLRDKIDEIDDKIVKLLLDRFAVVKNVAEYKKARGLEILQKSREAEILQKISAKTDNYSEYKKYILKIYADILETSKSSQV